MFLTLSLSKKRKERLVESHITVSLPCVNTMQYNDMDYFCYRGDKRYFHPIAIHRWIKADLMWRVLMLFHLMQSVWLYEVSDQFIPLFSFSKRGPIPNTSVGSGWPQFHVSQLFPTCTWKCEKKNKENKTNQQGRSVRTSRVQNSANTFPLAVIGNPNADQCVHIDWQECAGWQTINAVDLGLMCDW